MKRVSGRATAVMTLGWAAGAAGSRGETSGDWPVVFQTSRAGDQVARVSAFAEEAEQARARITVEEGRRFQTLRGFGGAFTESSAHVLSLLDGDKRSEVLEAYFSPEHAGYSLMRTHIASCDFSLGNYTYAPVPGDSALEHFSIEHDRSLLLPLIKDAMAVPGADFRLLASPWTAPPWMKDNADWNGGRLRPEHGDTFARYLARYLKAYEEEGVPIWGLTPVNEPEGNDSNWESMHFTPEEMKTFLLECLGPTLEREGLDTKVFVFDQNRNHMEAWADALLGDPAAARYVAGTAVHWYSSTVDYYGDALQRLRERYPDKEIMQTEGCIDSLGDDEPAGAWLEADWYWRKEATDWGYVWAPDELKPDHPMYVPVYRYVRDMIGTLNNWVTGWVDWNIVLDFRGGPNHANNFCGAPVLVDPDAQRVFYTPLFYAMTHFSRFIRPGAIRIGCEVSDDSVMATAVLNADGGAVVVVFNEGMQPIVYELSYAGRKTSLSIPAQAIQTIVFGKR